MKRNAILAGFFFLIIFSCDQRRLQDEQVIELPISFESGFGPFGWNYSLMKTLYLPDDPDATPWNKMYLPLRGIPKEWKSVVKSNIWLDAYQLLYQNYHQGNMDSLTYQKLAKSWKWTPDETRLSRLPIRCDVYVVRGVDKSGKIAMLIDTNNDRDFSDELPFYPENAVRGDSLRYFNKTHPVAYDVVQNGKITVASIRMAVKYLPAEPLGFQYWYTFPQYAKATLIHEGKSRPVAINTGFSSPWSEFSELTLPEKLSPDQVVQSGQGTGAGYFFELDGAMYQNLGVDLQKKVLRLKRKSRADNINLNQVGSTLQTFTAQDFLTNKTISSSNYKDKYLFIDFWGSWCKPCVAELPALKKLYQKLDKNRIGFVSIAGLENPARLKQFLLEFPMDWPQILSDQDNKLVETYHIFVYPSNMLIGPDGKIIAKNIHGKKLEEILEKEKCFQM